MIKGTTRLACGGLLAIALVISAPGETRAQPAAKARVAVTPPAISGKAGPNVAALLAKKLHDGLQASGLEAVAAKRKRQGACGVACVRRIGRRHQARYVAGARITADHPFYKLHLWIADARSGTLVATVNSKCDVCPSVAVASRMELSASRLAVALRERAKKPAVFVVTSDPAGAEVYVDDKLKGQTPLRLELPRGAYVLEVRREGYYAGRQELKAVAAVEQKVNVALVPKSKGGGTLTTVLGWSAIGAGVAAIVAGAVLLAIDGNGTDCVGSGEASGDVCLATNKTALPGWLLVGSGAALAGGGAALLFWPRGGSKGQKSALSNTRRITIAPTGLGLGLRGTF